MLLPISESWSASAALDAYGFAIRNSVETKISRKKNHVAFNSMLRPSSIPDPSDVRSYREREYRRSQTRKNIVFKHEEISSSTFAAAAECLCATGAEHRCVSRSVWFRLIRLSLPPCSASRERGCNAKGHISMGIICQRPTGRPDGRPARLLSGLETHPDP